MLIITEKNIWRRKKQEKDKLRVFKNLKGYKLRVFFDFQKNENKHYYISSACSRIDNVEKGGEHRQIEYWHHLRHSWYGLAIVYQRTYIYF